MELDRRSLLRLAAAGVVAPLLASPARRRPPSRPGARGAGGRALVTADLDGFVAVVDLERRRVVRRLATRDGPRSLETRAGAGSGALVGHAALGVVTLLRVGPEIGVRRVLGGFGEPRYAAIAPGGAHAFVTDSGHGELAVDRPARRARRAARGGRRRARATSRSTRAGARCGSRSARPRPSSSSSTSPTRSRRASCAGSRRRSARTTSRSPPAGGASGSPAGARRGSRCTTPTAGAAGAAHGAPQTIAAGAAPQHVTFGPHAAYVASGEGRSLTVHALGDGRPRGRAVTPLGSYNVARGAGRVLTPSLHSGELTVLDAAGRVRWSVTIGAAAHDVCVL